MTCSGLLIEECKCACCALIIENVWVISNHSSNYCVNRHAQYERVLVSINEQILGIAEYVLLLLQSKRPQSKEK